VGLAAKAINMDDTILHHFDDFQGFIGDKPYRGTAEMFFCPGCGYGHWFATGPGGWTWDGDREKPTARPSILQTITKEQGGMRCHLIMTDGQLQFLADSEHSLAGTTVPMEAF